MPIPCGARQKAPTDWMLVVARASAEGSVRLHVVERLLVTVHDFLGWRSVSDDIARRVDSWSGAMSAFLNVPNLTRSKAISRLVVLPPT